MRSRPRALATALAVSLLSVPLPLLAALGDAVFIASWGRKVPLPDGTFQTPTADAVDSVSGDVYTVEPKGIQRWDRNGLFLRSWPCSCQGIAVNSVTHDVYATSWATHTVLQFSSEGALVRE